METIKGTITRRMDSVFNGLQEEFKDYNIKDFNCQLNKLKKAKDKSNRPFILKDLYYMFDKCGIQYEKGKDNNYYEKLIKNSDIPSFSEMEDRILNALYTRYKEYPSPEDYMKRMVDRLSCDKDDWSNDTLRVRILKQFIKYGNYLTDAGFGGRRVISDYVREKTGKKPSEEDIIVELNDDVFDGLKTATKFQKRPEGKYGLLKTVDDLATGKFRTEGATKRSLYLFAMVYGMTYYSRKVPKVEKTDIEKNLFKDYYVNNLMRFISDSYKGKLNSFELDPSGQGINYKNFAEMIYLYYISKDCTPQEKIRLSSEMIKRVQDKQIKKGKPVLNKVRLSSEMVKRIQGKQIKKGKPVLNKVRLSGDMKKKIQDNLKESDTIYYKKFMKKDIEGSLYSEDIISFSEDKFEEFICNHYNCDTYLGSYEIKGKEVYNKTGVFQLETEQNTAKNEYKELIKKLLEKLDEKGCSIEVCNYGLWFTDVFYLKKKRNKNNFKIKRPLRVVKVIKIENNFKYILEERRNRKSFLELLLAINSFMRDKFVTSPSVVTRTLMIVAYYYYYNLIHEDDENIEWKIFEEHFRNFQKDINEILNRSCYLPLSGKNVFDVLIAFSSYAYLNM